MSTTKIAVPAKKGVILDLNVHVEFDTAKDVHYDVKIIYLIQDKGDDGELIYQSEKVAVSINDGEPTLMAERDFIKKMYIMFHFYGCKNIKRSVMDCPVEEHTSFHKFSEYWRENLHILLNGDDYEPDWSDEYSLRVLFGLLVNVRLY